LAAVRVDPGDASVDVIKPTSEAAVALRTSTVILEDIT
jgi:hypothetical protein